MTLSFKTWSKIQPKNVMIIFKNHRRLFCAAPVACASVSEILESNIVGISDGKFSVKGWIKRIREQKQMTFMVFNDGTVSDLQVVMPTDEFSTHKIKTGSAVEMTGRIVKSGGRGQKFDFIPDKISVIGDVDLSSNTYVSPYSETFVMDPNIPRRNLQHRLKLESFNAILRLRNAAKQAMHQFFQQRGFIQIDTPILTTADCEGAGESFYVQPSNKSIYLNSTAEQLEESVEDVPEGEENLEEILEMKKREFFAQPVFMTVSSQMHLEASACAFKNVYSFNPAFRAESSLSRQHLAEFYMLEAECSFLNDLNVLISIVQRLVINIADLLFSTFKNDIEKCLHRKAKQQLASIEKLLETQNFPRISYDEAMDIVIAAHHRAPFVRALKNGDDFDKEHEKYIVKHFGDVPVFVTHYPSSHKPFYMKRTEDDRRAHCFDLLAPHSGEICGGSLREDSYETVVSRLESMNLHKRLKWYADLRKIGYAPTGGFGLGFERYLQFILGLHNIKDTLPFPRWYKHCNL